MVVNGRDQARTERAVADMQRELGVEGGLLAVGADTSQRADAERLVETTLGELGRLDILVNNAGINLDERVFEDHTIEDWRRIAQVNLEGPINCTHVRLEGLHSLRKEDGLSGLVLRS